MPTTKNASQREMRAEMHAGRFSALGPTQMPSAPPDSHCARIASLFELRQRAIKWTHLVQRN
jgi:hypothetical protein